MSAVFIRIALRYVCGYLVIKNILPQDIADVIANDPDLAMVIGLAVALVVETAYGLAKRWGWTT